MCGESKNSPGDNLEDRRHPPAVPSPLREEEVREQELEVLRRALIEGEESGSCSPFDMEAIIASAREKAGLGT